MRGVFVTGLALALAGAPASAAGQPPGTAAPPPPRTPLDEGRPVGGYWGPGERPSPEPKDGHWNIVVGGILIPLGAIGTGAAAGGAYATSSKRCEELLGQSPDSCRGYNILSWVRLGYSGLMLVSGAVILGMGLHQRNVHREWKKNRAFSLAPMPARRGGGVSLRVRF